MFDWRKYSWKAARPILVSVLQSALSKVTGPVGWIALKIVPIFVDKLAKPAWQWATRKIRKKSKVIQGKKKAKEIRDASTDDIDDIYDNMR